MSRPEPEVQAALDQLTAEVAAGRGALRLAALATIAGHEPQVRTVIIRQFSQAGMSLVFFCRADDAKFGEIASHGAVELVCYARDPDRQIRLAGSAVNLTDAAELDRLWTQVSTGARRDYVAVSSDDADVPPSADRAPLFRAITVSIRRVKVLTFEQDRWVDRSYLPGH
jgi:pyridoxine/pyridoxamine 5'-phosphate oxidase